MRRLLAIPALALLCAAATPDVLLPGQKGIHHTYRLTGLERFPGYRFLSAPKHLDGWQWIEEGKPFTWYKLHGARIYAVPQGTEVPAEYSVDFLATLPCTAEELHVQSVVDEGSPCASRNTVCELRSVSPGGVEIAVVRDEYLDENGEPVGAGRSPTPWLVGTACVAALLLLGLRRRGLRP